MLQDRAGSPPPHDHQGELCPTPHGLLAPAEDERAVDAPASEGRQDAGSPETGDLPDYLDTGPPVRRKDGA